MSSAKNHAKRSHRSEHFKKANVGTSCRRCWLRTIPKSQRAGLFARFRSLFRHKPSEN